MQKITIDSANIRISEESLIFDTGSHPTVDIGIAQGISVKYCFVPTSSGNYIRNIDIEASSKFDGTAVIVTDESKLTITSNILGDTVKSNLALLVIAKSESHTTLE